MKILVISDSHGNIANIKHVMGFAQKIKAKAVIHCGDWDNLEAVNTVLSFNIPLYAILGNADIDLDIEEKLKFNTKGFDPTFLSFKIDGRKIGVIHEAKDNDKRFEGLSVVFSGHFHSQYETMINFAKYVRPGALINGINFAIYETETNAIELINATVL